LGIIKKVFVSLYINRKSKNQEVLFI